MFHIYSQNDISDYSNYCLTDIELHLNDDLFNTFTGMVSADILVMSRSSLSYVAAILSDGEIYYQQFWHSPADHWIIC